jgi:multiple sugar transport system substrate-binding protein
MLVNKPWFEENGLSYPTTWDEMINIAKANSQSEGDVFTMRGFDFVSADSLCYTWLSMILSSGGQYLKDDGSFDFNTPKAKETFQLLYNYLAVDKLASPAALTGGTDKENFDWVFLGQALMAPRGIWVIPTGDETYGVKYGTDFDYVPVPFYGPEKKWAAETGWAMGVNANTKYSEEAWKFVEFLMEPENLVSFNIACAMIPPSKTVAHDPSVAAAMPYAQPILDVLDGAQFVGHINTDILKQACFDAMNDMLANGTSVDDAVMGINNTCNG